MGLTYTHTFPNVPQYWAELYISSAGLATANIQCRVTSKSSAWDWYVNNPGATVHFYIDGIERYSGDLSTWGAGGSGLNGVQSSAWINFGNFSISKTSTIQLIIDCSSKPIIYLSSGTKSLGYLNSGAYTPNWEAEIIFLRPPVISSLYNNNMYNNQAEVSASTTSISIGARLSSAGDAATNWWYALYGGDWVECGNPTNIPNLEPGTVYSAKMHAQNAAGYHEYGWITIRTRHNKPILTLNPPPDSEITDQMIFEWSSDKNCQQLKYKYRNISELEETNPNYTWNDGWSSDIILNLSGSPISGSVIVTDLQLGSKYQFLVSVLSSYDYDTLWSDEMLMGVESVQPAYLLEPFEYEYGESLNLIRNNPSGLANVIEITAKNTGILVAVKRFESEEKNQGDQSFTIDDVSEDKWDELYRLLENTNIILDLTIKIGTISGTEIIYNEYDGILILTGNVRTVRVYTHNQIDKTKSWIIEQGRQVRAVGWIGDKDNKPQRCIIDDNQKIEP